LQDIHGFNLCEISVFDEQNNRITLSSPQSGQIYRGTPEALTDGSDSTCLHLLHRDSKNYWTANYFHPFPPTTVEFKPRIVGDAYHKDLHGIQMRIVHNSSLYSEFTLPALVYGSPTKFSMTATGAWKSAVEPSAIALRQAVIHAITT